MVDAAILSTKWRRFVWSSRFVSREPRRRTATTEVVALTAMMVLEKVPKENGASLQAREMETSLSV